MENVKQKNFLLEIAEQQGDIIYKDNKTLAKLSWLKPWEKNPKLSEAKDLKRLENQIETLGIYKPLVVYLEKNNATILGGNQRYKVLKTLNEKYTQKKQDKYGWVWVSVVNADNDYDKMKYALSDNEQIGKYDREKLKELLEVQMKQGNLLSDYSVDFGEGKTLDKLIDDLNLTEQEMQFKNIKRQLTTMGINDETIKALETMTTFNKINENLADVDIKGCITGQKFPLLFWVEDEVSFEELQKIYGTKYKDRYDTEKLKYVTENILNIHIPNTEEELTKLGTKIEELNKRITEAKELGGTVSTLEKLKNELNTVVLRVGHLINDPMLVDGGEQSTNGFL